MVMLLSKKVYRELMFLFVVYSKLHHKASWKNCKNGMVFPSSSVLPYVVSRPLLKVLKVLVANHATKASSFLF